MTEAEHIFESLSHHDFLISDLFSARETIKERRKTMGLISRLLTRNRTRIPLYFVTFDYQRYKKDGLVGSCDLRIHPMLAGDEELKQKLNDVTDYIRNKYNMKEM